MNLTNCPHCTSPIPSEFAAMPICSICGGDLSSAPAAPVWSSVDIKTDNSRVCPSCNENIKSILAMECPSCGAALTPAGKAVEDVEKEKEAFEAAVNASKSVPHPHPTHISDEIDHNKIPEVVHDIVEHLPEEEMEVAPLHEEIKMPESVVIKDEDKVIEEPPTIPVPEKVILNNPIMNPVVEEAKAEPVLRSSTTEKEIKPYPEREKEEDFVPLKEKAQQKKKEGFFARIMRFFGFGDD